MLIKKNSDITIKTSLTIYFLTFLIGFPFINRLNPLFYVFLTIAWIIFCTTYYLIITRSESFNLTKFILLGSFLVGLILNFSSNFTLSDDIYRYLFDGFLIKHQINPYLYAPNSLAISSITSSFPYLTSINNASVASPYPPLMILISFIFVSFAGYSLVAWLILVNILVLAIGFLLVKILKMLSLNPNYVLLWFNPLVLLVFNSSGHNDIFALFFVVLSISFLVKSKSPGRKDLILSGSFLAVAIGIKLFPILFVPFFIKKLGIGFIFTGLLTSFQFILYVALINVRNSGFIIFLESWRGNGGLFEIIYFIFNGFNYYRPNSMLQIEIRVLFTVFFGLALLAIFLLHIGKNFMDQTDTQEYKSIFNYIGISFIAMLLLSPVIHPWYVLWAIIPFILVIEKKFYPYWIFLIINSFSYLLYLSFSLIFIFMFIEYTIFYSSIILFIIQIRYKNVLKKFNMLFLHITVKKERF